VAPPTFGVLKLNALPAQTGLVLVAFAFGPAETVTVVVEVLEHPFALTVTVYTPLIVVEALVSVGFCNDDV
jgi:hypothetical protein